MTAARFSALASPRAPLFAGGATAFLFAAGIGVIAIFGQADFVTPAARGIVDPPPAEALRTEISDAAGPAGAAIRFDTPEGEEEPSLPGVEDGFPAVETSDPAAAGAASAAAAPGAAEVSYPSSGLGPSRVPGLTEPGPGGPLPVIGADGRRPADAYARPFDGDPATPTIAVVIGGLGLNAAVTESAIAELPPEVALSFAPYSEDLQGWIDRARAAGHEVLIETPMEPYDYPNNDPGPHTLLANGPDAENTRRLYWVLSRATGYYGVTNYLGARFSASSSAVGHVMETLESRGVAFLHDGAGRRSTIEDAGQSAGAQWAIADRVLDEDPSPRAIDDRLLTLEALALQDGASIGSGFAYPATIDQVRDWAGTLQARGYQLAPPSAVMKRRAIEARQVEASLGEDHAADGHQDEGDGH